MRGVKLVIIEDKIIHAKTNSHALNDLLSEYRPFIQKVVYDTCRRYVEWGRDEELSIGLLAFEEAVNRYEADKGSFMSLARQIIKSRVIDYLRKENRHNHYDIDEVNDSVIAIDYTNLIAEEIAELQTHLSGYDISFQDLPEVSPVKRKLREELKQAAVITAKDEELINTLLDKRLVPVKAIAKKSGISYKKIERNRLYLITMALIWHLDLPLLQGYIK